MPQSILYFRHVRTDIVSHILKLWAIYSRDIVHIVFLIGTYFCGIQWVAGIKKAWHAETTPSDFRKNLRNHGGPQARLPRKAKGQTRV